MPRIYSKRRGTERPPFDAVLCDRTTVYGNPFIIGIHGNRDEVVQKHRVWIEEDDQKWLRDLIKKELRGRDLVCWCYPEPCHLTIVMEIANG